MATRRRKKEKTGDEQTEFVRPSHAPTEAAKPKKATQKKGCDRADIVEAIHRECVEHGVDERTASAISEQVSDHMGLAGEDIIGEELFYDLKILQDYTYPGGKRKALIRGNAVVKRDPKTINTIVIHQTGVRYGVSRWQVKKAGGDKTLALATRALDVACHAMAFRAGFFVSSHDVLDYVNHAGRFNATSVGLEIDGVYAGLAGGKVWRGVANTLDEKTAAAACNAVDYLCAEVKRAGGEITRVVSHRQSSDARRSDPGEEIWKRVAIQHCQDTLGLDLYLDSPWKNGRPVPVEWDPNGQGEY